MFYWSWIHLVVRVIMITKTNILTKYPLCTNHDHNSIIKVFKNNFVNQTLYPLTKLLCPKPSGVRIKPSLEARH